MCLYVHEKWGQIKVGDDMGGGGKDGVINEF